MSGFAAPSTQTTVEQSVATGDAALVEQAIQANHANSVVASLARAMIAGDAHATIVLALKCVKGATEAHAIQVALGCARILGGTFLSEGDIGGWSRQISWLRTIGFPALMKTAGKPVDLGGGLDDLKFAELMQLPRPEILVEHSDVVLPLEYVGETTMPIVEIEVDGQRVHALVDTGSANALILIGSRAKSLGIDRIAKNLALVGSDLINLNDASLRTNSLGMTSNVRVGPIEMKGLGVIIVDGLEGGRFEAVVGLPLLLKLKGFQFGPRSISLYGNSTPVCDIGYPFSIANAAGRRQIQFPAVIGGEERDVFFDTGSEGPIAIQGDLARRLDVGKTPLSPQTLTTVEGEYHLQAGFAKASLSLLGRQFEVATMRLVPDATQGIPVLVGARSLPEMSFRIDRASNSACLVSDAGLHERDPQSTLAGKPMAYFGYGSNQEADGPSRQLLRMKSMVITKVDPDSPAYKAGLKVGDRITEYGGIKVNGALADRIVAIHNALKVGDILKLKILGSKGVPRTVSITATGRPDSSHADK
jgi:hypothetical protein